MIVTNALFKKMVKKLMLLFVGSVLFIYLVTDFEMVQNKRPNKRILYLSTHKGACEEAAYVFERYGIDYTTGGIIERKEYEFFTKTGWLLTEQLAEEYAASVTLNKVCNEFDMIMFGELIPMGWPMYLASNKQSCRAKIALQIMMRFNFGPIREDMPAYLHLMQNLTRNRNVYWVPNNPYEIFYLNKYNIFPKPEQTFMIRPFGVSFLSGKYVGKKKTIIYSLLAVQLIRDTLKRNVMLDNDKYEIHSGQTYGGPLTM